MTPEDLRRGEATQIRALTGAPPEEAAPAGLEGMIQQIVAREVAAAFATVRITGSGNIHVSGNFPVLTIAEQGGVTTATAVCNTDGTITITIK